MDERDPLLTTRQLQDLLQVDRITIYRMLSDGRIRGFKVGGQWRFSRHEIDSWLQARQGGPDSPPPPHQATKQPDPSSQALSTPCIQAVQDICAEALEIAAVTTELDGRPLTSISNSCALCSQILGTQSGRRRCAASWGRATDGQIHVCHAGLQCASRPIVIGEQPVALIAFCQFVSQSPETTPAWQTNLPILATGLGMSDDGLRSAADSVPAISDAHQARITRLLERVAGTFSEIGQERWDFVTRLQIISELSEA
jgi:excisionase family DNA binding protein